MEVKPYYKKPPAVKELEQLANLEARKKYPGTPSHLLAPRKYRDDRANDLTKCITDYIKFCEGSAYRINSQGQYDPKLKKWRYSGMRKGLPDIMGTINGQSIQIEVKIGRDRLSVHQEKIKDEVTRSGVLFFVATNFTEFKQWFDNLNNENRSAD